MILTDKCKKDFEKWLNDNFNTRYASGVVVILDCGDVFRFKDLPQAMQYGVYVDFFDSLGVHLDAYRTIKGYSYMIQFAKKDFEVMLSPDVDTRQEARTKAIEKANEIYNKRND